MKHVEVVAVRISNPNIELGHFKNFNCRKNVHSVTILEIRYFTNKFGKKFLFHLVCFNYNHSTRKVFDI